MQTTLLTVLMGTTLVRLSLAGSFLEPLIAEALERNPEVVEAREKWAAAKWRIPQARGFPDPMIGASWMREGSRDVSDYAMIEWMVTQSLPGFGKRDARSKLADREAETAAFEYLDTVRRVRAQVVAGAWNLWAVRRDVEVAREAVAIARALEGAVVAAYEAGKVPLSDLLRSQIERATLQDEFITLEQQTRVALANLNALLNAPPETPRETADGPIERPPLPDLDQLLKRARQRNGWLLASASEMEARRADLARARAEQRPDVELFVKARQPRGDSRIQEYDTGIALSWPWPWHGKYSAGIREAHARLSAAEANFTHAQRRLDTEVLDRYVQAESLERRIRLYEDAIRAQARKGVDSVLAEYATGRSDFAKVVDALNAWLRIEREYLRAVSGYSTALAQLEQLTGADTDDDIRGTEGGNP